MPIYEYECRECSEIFELLHLGSTAEENVHCPKCHAVDVGRVLSTFSSATGQSTDVGCGPSGST